MTFATPSALAYALRQAAAAHHEFEQATGQPDANWADWYAQWLFDGRSEPSATVAADYVAADINPMFWR